MRDSSGFTLLEMLVVLAIIAGLSVVTPFVGHSLLDRARLRFAERSVIARIYGGQTRAELTGASTDLRLLDLQSGLAASIDLEEPDRPGPLGVIRLYADGSSSLAKLVIKSGRLTTTVVLDRLTGELHEAD